ncbi:MAG: ABC transporter ATP-binding protein [Ilumatobacteraceae bacterium]|nr:ABC transporter ATP-binding protein [Ilumatobacteraceae bacterium]
MTAAVGLVSVTRRIGARPVVDDVTLEVRERELLTLVGPSGCGKSTLLRLIAGLERPTSGTITLGGLDVTDVAPERRRIGLVFQEHALFPHLTVGRNVAFGLRRMDRRRRAERIEEMLELVRLPGATRRYPHELSGGEQQRVALARALAPDPVAVLLDEPFANLDASLRDELRADVVAVLRERGATALLVTHDRDEALALGDRVAVMRDGALVQVARPEVVWSAPNDGFVAGFLGPMSLLPSGDGQFEIVRPHQFELVSGGDDRVVEREFRGAVWRHTIVRADGTQLIVDAEPGRDLEVGATCAVTVRPGHLPARLTRR